jgi:hypothetical protein
MERPAEPPALPTPRKPRSGGLLRLVLVLVLVGGVMLAALAVFAPWGFHMGGQFHIIPMWQGVGRLHSNSAGGDYAIYVWFWPDSGRLRGLTYVKGNAMLCTPRGERFNLTLGGNFERPAGLDLNGKTASFYMYNRTVKHILSGGNARPELELRGRWNNPDLALDDHSSLQRNFDHDARLRTSLTGVPYLGEVSPVTLRQGGKSDFEAACAAVKR